MEDNVPKCCKRCGDVFYVATSGQQGYILIAEGNDKTYICFLCAATFPFITLAAKYSWEPTLSDIPLHTLTNSDK